MSLQLFERTAMSDIVSRNDDEFTWATKYLDIRSVDFLTGKIDMDAVDEIIRKRTYDLLVAQQILHDLSRESKRQKRDSPLLEGTPNEDFTTTTTLVASTSIPSTTVEKETLLILKAAGKKYKDVWLDSDASAWKRTLSFDGSKSDNPKARSIIVPGAWILDKNYVLVGKVLRATRPDENINTYHLEVHMAKKMSKELTIPPMLFCDTTEHRYYRFANAICHWFGVPREDMKNKNLMSGVVAIKEVAVSLNRHVELLEEPPEPPPAITHDIFQE